jgi:replicative DNA helicase
MKDFNADFEEEVLAECLRDSKYLCDAARVLDHRHFVVNEHAWVWRTMRSVWVRSNETATPALFSSRAAMDLVDDDSRAVHLSTVVKLFRRKSSAARATLEELRRFVRAAQLQAAIEASVKSQEQGKWEEAWDPITELLRKDVKRIDYRVSRWIEEFDERQQERCQRREHPELFRSIPTGYRQLDRRIVGAQEGELCGIMATTNKGKSVLATNIGFNACSRGYGVVHFSTEMSHKKVAQRYDSRFTHVEYRKFKRFDFTPYELEELAKVVEANKKKFHGRLRIISTPLRSCDVDLIRRAVDDMRVEMPRIDMIIVDSGDHLQPRGHFDKPYQAEGSNFWDLKDLAEELDVPVWVTLQAKQEFETKTASTRAAAGSYDKSRICDLMISINEPEKVPKGAFVTSDDEDEPITSASTSKRPDLLLYVAKCRDDESKFFIPIEADMRHMHMRELEQGGEPPLEDDDLEALKE